MKKFGSEKLWRVLGSTFLMLNVFSIAGSAVTKEWSGYINKYLGISNTRIVDDVDQNVDTTYFKSAYASYTEVLEASRAVAKKIQGEGTVLMTNKNGTLPLSEQSKVTFLSYSTVDIAVGGTGSGGVVVSPARKVDIEKACESGNKLDLNETMYNFYKDKLAAEYMAKNGALIRKVGGGFGPSATPISYQVPEVVPADFTNEVNASFAEYDDAAIFVLTRIGGEGNDLTAPYLSLSAEERLVLEAMKNGPFAKRIVLVNTFNTPVLDWLDEYNIDACLYIGGPGEVGLDAVTDVLVGRTNPSGRLANTYVSDVSSSPAMQNFGNFEFTNSAEINNADSRKYLMYNEGIYVGYKYYETRYEDSVLNRFGAKSTVGTYASADVWQYEEEVVFPFGHGLSYTSFDQTLKNVAINERDKKAEVTVTVENTGNKAGKEVVQVYAQAPYVVGGVEKSAVQLVGFDKTNLLAAGQKVDVKINIDLNDLASYDYQTHKTYIMDDGDYYFAIGHDAHSALNNILAKKGVTATDAPGNSAQVSKWVKSNFSVDEYRLSATKRAVTNKFEDADINYYKEGNTDIVTYLSRSNWQTTWPQNMTGFAATPRMIADMHSYYDASNNPSGYTPGSSDISNIVVGSTETQYNIAMMRGVDYDDPAWDLLISQISIEELAAFSKQGRPAIISVGQPSTTAVDGPAAWTKSTYKIDYEDYTPEAAKTTENMVLYPTETVVASTWNVDLAKELGQSFGEEGLWGGGVGWYGPGANLHRTPLGGRNFEYFSEDGLISGKLGEAEVHGAMEYGVIPYFKHFFLNDQETNRIGVCTFANEQSIREIYLRAFQYAFETTGEDDPACTGVMGAFNRLGVVWTGHSSNLWKGVMATEWGFTGNVTTDFGQKPQSLMDPMLAYEAGTTMFCTSGTTFETIIVERAQADSKLLVNMQEATKRNLYNFANSAAMNGLSSTSRIVIVRTWYENALIGMMSASSILSLGSFALLGLSIFSKKEIM